MEYKVLIVSKAFIVVDRGLVNYWSDISEPVKYDGADSTEQAIALAIPTWHCERHPDKPLKKLPKTEYCLNL
jgi:hypothetical protein